MHRPTSTRGLSAPAMMLAVSLIAGTAHADFMISYTNNYNNGSPSGTSPYATATFQNAGPNAVTLTINNLLSSSYPSQFIPEIYFNLDPAISPASLTFTYSSGQAAVGILHATADHYSPPGQGGAFDIEFDYGISNSPDRFTAGETSVYTITGPGLTADSFLFTSVGDNNSFYSALKTQGIPSGSDSAETASGSPTPIPGSVPEPSSLALSGIAGLIGLAFARRRARSNG